ALIELNATYQELEEKGARVYEISSHDAKPGDSVVMITGFHKEKQLCSVSHVVDRLLEDQWESKGALALSEPCEIRAGWSGTPLVDPASFPDRPVIVGLLNSYNTTGGLCTLDNPCEVSPTGEKLAFRGRAYAQSIAGIMACV